MLSSFDSKLPGYLPNSTIAIYEGDEKIGTLPTSKFTSFSNSATGMFNARRISFSFTSVKNYNNIGYQITFDVKNKAQKVPDHTLFNMSPADIMERYQIPEYATFMMVPSTCEIMLTWPVLSVPSEHAEMLFEIPEFEPYITRLPSVHNEEAIILGMALGIPESLLRKDMAINFKFVGDEYDAKDGLTPQVPKFIHHINGIGYLRSGSISASIPVNTDISFAAGTGLTPSSEYETRILRLK